jgi:hypothetical protein
LLASPRALALQFKTVDLSTHAIIQEFATASVSAETPGILRITAPNGDLYDLRSASGDDAALTNLASTLPVLDRQRGLGTLTVNLWLEAAPVWELIGSSRRCTLWTGGSNFNKLEISLSSYLYDAGLTFTVTNLSFPTYEVVTQTLPSETTGQTLEFLYPAGAPLLKFQATGQLSVYGTLTTIASGACYLDLANYCADRSYSSFNRVELFALLANGLSGGGNFVFHCTDDPGFALPDIGTFSHISDFTYDGRTLRNVWREIHFGTTYDGGTAADSADPDGDGRNNLLEYAIGSDPLGVDPGPAWLAPNSHNLEFHFRGQRNATDLTYHVDASTNLVDWSEIWSNAEARYSGDLHTFEQTVVDPQILGATPRRFLRLRVTTP